MRMPYNKIHPIAYVHDEDDPVGQSYGLIKTPENWEQLAQHTGACTTSKISPGALENRRGSYGEPTGTARKWPKLLFLLAVRGP